MATDKEATAADGSKGVATAAAAVGEKEVTGSKMITLKSKEGTTFEVSQAAAQLSSVLSGKLKMIDGDCNTSDGVQLPDVGAAALEKVVEYLEKHAETAPDDEGTAARREAVRTRAVEGLEKWDADLVDGVVGGSQGALFDLILAAGNLGIDGLLDAGCQKIANMMRGKTTEQIRGIFDIQNDFTSDEEREVRREHAWAFPRDPNPIGHGGGAPDAAAADDEDGDGDGGDEDDEEEEADESGEEEAVEDEEEDP